MQTNFNNKKLLKELFKSVNFYLSKSGRKKIKKGELKEKKDF